MYLYSATENVSQILRNWIFCACVLPIATVLVANISYGSRDHTTLSTVSASLGQHDTYTPNIEFSYKIGNKRNIGQLTLLWPLWQRSDRLIFLDLVGMKDSRSAREGNFGIGYRQLVDNRIYGGYAFFDRRRTERGFYFNQLTLGAEWMAADWEWRANVYLPISARKPISTPIVTGDVSSDGNIVAYRRFISQNVVSPLYGFDIEAGIGELGKLQGFLGYYQFFAKQAPSIYGARMRVLLPLIDWLVVEGELMHDNVREFNYFAGLRAHWKLGKKQKNQTPLERKMTQIPVRDVDVVTVDHDAHRLLDELRRKEMTAVMAKERTSGLLTSSGVPIINDESVTGIPDSDTLNSIVAEVVVEHLSSPAAGISSTAVVKNVMKKLRILYRLQEASKHGATTVTHFDDSKGEFYQEKVPSHEQVLIKATEQAVQQQVEVLAATGVVLASAIVQNMVHATATVSTQPQPVKTAPVVTVKAASVQHVVPVSKAKVAVKTQPKASSASSQVNAISTPASTTSTVTVLAADQSKAQVQKLSAPSSGKGVSALPTPASTTSTVTVLAADQSKAQVQKLSAPSSGKGVSALPTPASTAGTVTVLAADQSKAQVQKLPGALSSSAQVNTLTTTSSTVGTVTVLAADQSKGKVQVLPPSSSSAEVAVLPAASSSGVKALPSSGAKARVKVLPSTRSAGSVKVLAATSKSSDKVKVLSTTSSSNARVKVLSSTRGTGSVKVLPIASKPNSQVEVLSTASISSAQVQVLPATASTNAQVEMLPTAPSTTGEVNALPNASSTTGKVSQLSAQSKGMVQVLTPVARQAMASVVKAHLADLSSSSQVKVLDRASHAGTVTVLAADQSKAQVQKLPAPSSGTQVTVLSKASSAGVKALPSTRDKARVKVLPTTRGAGSVKVLPTTSKSSDKVRVLSTASSPGARVKVLSTTRGAGSVKVLPIASKPNAQVETLSTASISSAQVQVLPATASTNAQVEMLPTAPSTAGEVNVLPNASSTTGKVNQLAVVQSKGEVQVLTPVARQAMVSTLKAHLTDLNARSQVKVLDSVPHASTVTVLPDSVGVQVKPLVADDEDDLLAAPKTRASGGSPKKTPDRELYESGGSTGGNDTVAPFSGVLVSNPILKDTEDEDTIKARELLKSLNARITAQIAKITKEYSDKTMEQRAAHIKVTRKIAKHEAALERLEEAREALEVDAENRYREDFALNAGKLKLARKHLKDIADDQEKARPAYRKLEAELKALQAEFAAASAAYEENDSLYQTLQNTSYDDLAATLVEKNQDAISAAVDQGFAGGMEAVYVYFESHYGRSLNVDEAKALENKFRGGLSKDIPATLQNTFIAGGIQAVQDEFTESKGTPLTVQEISNLNAKFRGALEALKAHAIAPATWVPLMQEKKRTVNALRYTLGREYDRLRNEMDTKEDETRAVQQRVEELDARYSDKQGEIRQYGEKQKQIQVNGHQVDDKAMEKLEASLSASNTQLKEATRERAAIEKQLVTVGQYHDAIVNVLMRPSLGPELMSHYGHPDWMTVYPISDLSGAQLFAKRQFEISGISFGLTRGPLPDETVDQVVW